MMNNMGIGAIVAKMAQRDNGASGDYCDDDNLLICARCKTHKQAYKTILGQTMRVPIMCECEARAEDDARTHRERIAAAERIDRLRERGLTDQRYLRWTFSADDKKCQKVSDAARRYAEKWDEMRGKNIGLLFYGDIGVGKTFFAACIANYLIDHGTSVLMSNVSRLMSGMAQDFGNGERKIMEDVTTIPLLILDDLGTERGTEYAVEKLQAMIDARYRSGKPLIVTTNLTPADLKHPTDVRYKRVYDRVLEMCYPVLVTGESRREARARAMREDARDILGI